MTEMHERLKKAREDAGFKSAADAANRFGWAYSTYAGHENGSAGMRPATIAKYARAFKTDPSLILWGRKSPLPGYIVQSMFSGPEEEGENPEKAAVQGQADQAAPMIPVYDVQASAGDGSFPEAHEDVVEVLSFPRNYLKRIANRSSAKDLVIISAKGDSMLPTIASGDVVMVDVSKKDWGYDGLFVIRDGDGALLIKRLARSGRRGHVTIISDNSRLYPAIEAPAGEIEIVGKVLWMGVKV